MPNLPQKPSRLQLSDVAARWPVGRGVNGRISIGFAGLQVADCSKPPALPYAESEGRAHFDFLAVPERLACRWIRVWPIQPTLLY